MYSKGNAFHDLSVKFLSPCIVFFQALKDIGNATAQLDALCRDEMEIIKSSMQNCSYTITSPYWYSTSKNIRKTHVQYFVVSMSTIQQSEDQVLEGLHFNNSFSRTKGLYNTAYSYDAAMNRQLVHLSEKTSDMLYNMSELVRPFVPGRGKAFAVIREFSLYVHKIGEAMRSIDKEAGREVLSSE